MWTPCRQLQVGDGLSAAASESPPRKKPVLTCTPFRPDLCSLKDTVGLRWGLCWALTGLVACEHCGTCLAPSPVQGASLG